MTRPTMLPHGRDELLAWCRSVDEGPWSSLAVPERVTYTSHALTVPVHGRPVERIHTAWADAGRTEKPQVAANFWYALGPDAEVP